METITTRAEIDTNGVLRLELPTGLAPGPADVVLVVNRTTSRPDHPTPSLSGKYTAFARGDCDPIEEVRELRLRTTLASQE